MKYQPYFSGSGEYFQLNWTGSAQTLEFNFSFDPLRTSTTGNIFRLVSCDSSWLVGVYRERGLVWGRMFFSLDDGRGNIQTVMTGKAPIFDGSTYHTMLRRNDPSPLFDISGYTPSQADVYPVKYDLYLQKATDTRITFSASASYYFSGSFNANFRSGSFLYIGNYNQNTASLNVDPEAFFGDVDEIKVWEGAISDNSFTNHTLHQNAYDLDTPQQMVEENLFRLSFDRPVDLYDISGSVTLNNLSFRDDFPTFQAVNFPQFLGPLAQMTDSTPPTGSVFPYQFSRLDTIQTTKIPDYGAQKFKSNKINYIQQELVSNLSSTQRSSVQSSLLSSVDANKIGVFFSPIEIQNTEIIKFFGEYPLSDLIGDPSSVYARSYRKFEKFVQIFYDQGLGAVDYQFFMNIVRYYFDKAMLKYIKTLVPARAKLIDGILIEPSILERPKIQLKPIQQEVIPQNLASIPINKGTDAAIIPLLTSSLYINREGVSILEDVNQTFYPIVDDPYGRSVYADNRGITFYAGDYYRADVVKFTKKRQAYNKQNLPKNSLDYYEKAVNLDGRVQTTYQSYYVTSLASLPVVTSYSFTMSFHDTITPFYFSGSLAIAGIYGVSGSYIYTASLPHTLIGTISGPISGQIVGNQWQTTSILSSIDISASFSSASSAVGVEFSGSFSFDAITGTQMFDGTIGFASSTFQIHPYFSFYNTVMSTGNPTASIFDTFKANTAGPLFGPLGIGLEIRKDLSMQYYPENASLLTGYNSDHYKYGKEQFSQKVINSSDQNGLPYKWKKGSQTITTTVDPSSGLLNNSQPVVTTAT